MMRFMVEGTALSRRLYDLAQVDVLLRLSAGTARRWVEGYERAGKMYPPIVRIERTGDNLVTWGEFIEVALLAEYRKRSIAVQFMREVVTRLRERSGAAYPLAMHHPLVLGRDVVVEVQDEVGVPEEKRLVRAKDDQLVLAPAFEEFLDRVDFDDSPFVQRFLPRGRTSQVQLDPNRSFGQPSIDGIRTETVWEEFTAGDSIRSVADSYRLTVPQTEEAVRFHTDLIVRQAQAAA